MHKFRLFWVMLLERFRQRSAQRLFTEISSQYYTVYDFEDVVRRYRTLSPRTKVLVLRRLRLSILHTSDTRKAFNFMDMFLRLERRLLPLHAEMLERIILMHLQKESGQYRHFDLIERLFNRRIPESIIRQMCRDRNDVRFLREHGRAVPPDILDPLMEQAAARGNLEELLILHGPGLPERLLRTCMEAARAWRNPVATLECARLLRDYAVIAEVLAIAGTPHEMITAKLFQEGRVSKDALL